MGLPGPSERVLAREGLKQRRRLLAEQAHVQADVNRYIREYGWDAQREIGYKLAMARINELQREIARLPEAGE